MAVYLFLNSDTLSITITLFLNCKEYKMSEINERIANAEGSKLMLFSGSMGAFLDASFRVHDDEYGLSLGVNYSFVSNFITTKHAFVSSDVNDQNIETYLTIDEYILDKNIKNLIIIDCNIDDFEDFIQDYLKQTTFEELELLMLDGDSNKNIANSISDWLEKQK